MKARGYFKWDGRALIPDMDDENTRKSVQQLKQDDRVLVNYHRPRSIDHHRLAFAVFQRIAEATGKTVDTIYQELKFLTGRFDWIEVEDEDHNKRAAIILQSIAFEAMGQDEFRRFWDDALPVIYERWFPSLNKKEFDDLMSILHPGEEALRHE